MSAAIARRVAKGAALLDEKRPGWDAAIDLAALDLGSCHLCVVGQLFGPEQEYGLDEGPFGYGLNALGIPRFREGEYGFDRHAIAEEFADITAEWRKLIVARRLAAERVSAS